VSVTLAKYPIVFPPLVSSMIAIGEETGAVDAMLEKIASFYEREVDEAVDALTAALEPALIVVPRRCRRLHRRGHVPADVRHHRPTQRLMCGLFVRTS
jgi:hypothetical protein